MKKSSSDLTMGSMAKQLLMFGHTAHSSDFIGKTAFGVLVN